MEATKERDNRKSSEGTKTMAKRKSEKDETGGDAKQNKGKGRKTLIKKRHKKKRKKDKRKGEKDETGEGEHK